MKITKEMLVKAKACEDQVELFEQTFPDGAEWPSDMEKASRAGLDVVWAIGKFKLSGRSRGWYSDGQIMCDETWEKGEPHGRSRWWHSTGQLRLDETWENGKRHGRSRWWYSDGQLRVDETWENDKRHGRSRLWYSDGQKWWDETWENGRRVP